jgi:dolichyl-phosphate-mannose--protein O-mannosyl transferase
MNAFIMIMAAAWAVSSFIMGIKDNVFLDKSKNESWKMHGFAVLLFLLLVVSGFFLKRMRPSFL